MFNLDPMDNNFDGLDGLGLDFGTSGTGGDDDELSSLKEQLRKKESELEDQKFFLNDCDADMKTQIEEDIASYEKEIEELKHKIQEKEKEEENNSSN